MYRTLMGTTCLTLAIGTGLTTVASAQQAPNTGLEEIIVSAERREGNLQQVPVAVSAFSSESIERADIHNVVDIATRVPGFTYSQFAPGQAIFSLRGVSSNDDGAGTENSAAIFLDDVYIGRISNAAFDFFDVERVEVLRGPQGTLYGKNAIGGAINIVTKKPSTEETEIKLKAGYGRFDSINLTGYATGPLSDNLAAKVSGSYRKHDGYVTNILTGNGLLDEDVLSFRGQLLYHTDRTEVTLSLDTSREDRADMGRMPLPAAPVFGLFEGAGGSMKQRLATTPQEGFSKRDADGVSLKIDHELGNGTLTSVTGYRETSADWEMDSAGVPQVNVVDEIHDDTDSFTQEVRWAGDLSDTLDLVVGGFYLNEKTDRSEFFRFILGGLDDRFGPIGPTNAQDAVGGYRQINETDSLAAFAHANWQITPTVKLGAGIRYTKDKKNIVSSGTASGDDPTSPLSGFIINEIYGNIDTGTGIAAKDSWSNFSPKVTLDWQATEDLLVYASWSKGFKSGGFGAAPASAAAAADLSILSVDPEKADNYEIGFKGDFADNTFRVNVAAFYTDYKNLQFQRFGPSLVLDPNAPLGFSNDPNEFGAFRTVNAGNAEIKGVEAEITWVPVEGLTFNGAYGYLDATGDFNFREYFSDPAAVGDFIIARRLNRAPKGKGHFGATYQHTVADLGWLTWNADWQWTGTQRADVVNDDTIQDKFDVLDASVSFLTENEDWELTLWGKNLFDDRSFAHVYIIGPGQIGIINAPRTYGVSLTWNFN